MPLQKAVYAADIDKIFGLMGNRIVRFNATTGAKESMSAPFYSPFYNLSDIAYYSGNVYVCVCTAPMDTVTISPASRFTWWDIYRINATTLATTAMGFPSTWADWQTICASNSLYSYGPAKILIPDGTSFLYVHIQGWKKLFWIDLATPVNKGDMSVFQGSNEGWTEMAWNPLYNGAGGLFMSDSYGTEVDVFFPPFTNGVSYETLSLPWAATPDPMPKGIVHASAFNWIYVVTGQQRVWKIDPTAGALAIAATLTLPVGAKPIVARDNKNDGLIYMPNWDGNNIYVLNPADDSVVTKTGFDCPVDCVFTPTKKWAVQWAATALLPIT